ncbi:MAG: preprotein translocase subunit SecE [Candidatus Eremiobacterota bacterium]
MAAQEPAPSQGEAKKPRAARRERPGDGDKPVKRKKRGPKKAASGDGAVPAAGAPGPARTKKSGSGSGAGSRGLNVRERWDDFLKYLRSVRAEMKRVTWPTKKEVQVATVVVLITLAVVTGFIAVIDQVLRLVFK